MGKLNVIRSGEGYSTGVANLLIPCANFFLLIQMRHTNIHFFSVL